MDTDTRCAHDAIRKIRDLKRRGKSEKEELILICTELAIMKKEKQDLEDELRVMQQTIDQLRSENKKLRRYKEDKEKIITNGEEIDSNKDSESLKEVEIQCDILKNSIKQSRLTQTHEENMVASKACQVIKSGLSVHCDTEDLTSKENQATQTKLSYLQSHLQSSRKKVLKTRSSFSRPPLTEHQEERKTSLLPLISPQSPDYTKIESLRQFNKPANNYIQHKKPPWQL